MLLPKLPHLHMIMHGTPLTGLNRNIAVLFRLVASPAQDKGAAGKEGRTFPSPPSPPEGCACMQGMPRPEVARLWCNRGWAVRRICAGTHRRAAQPSRAGSAASPRPSPSLSRRPRGASTATGAHGSIFMPCAHAMRACNPFYCESADMQGAWQPWQRRHTGPAAAQGAAGHRALTPAHQHASVAAAGVQDPPLARLFLRLSGIVRAAPSITQGMQNRGGTLWDHAPPNP